MNHTHETAPAYEILQAAGMPECKWIRWDDRLECWWQWVSGDGVQGVWSPITDEVARDLLTMHALRWVIANGGQFHQAPRSETTEYGGRKIEGIAESWDARLGDAYGSFGRAEDLLDTIVEAVLALKGASK